MALGGRASRPIFGGTRFARWSFGVFLLTWAALALAAQGQKSATPSPLTPHFGQGGTAAEVPMELAANAVFVPVQVGGSQPSNWIIDTASPRTAASAPANPQASPANRPAQSTTLTLPGMKLLDPNLAAHSLEHLGPWYGLRVGGVLGDDFLTGVVAELDYARLSIEFYDASSYRQPGHMEKLPIHWVDGLPTIAARLRVGGQTIDGNFLLNTGGTSGVVVFRSFLSAKRSAQLSGKTLPGETVDASGAHAATLMRADWLNLGRIRVSRPIVAISESSDFGLPSGAGARKRKGDAVAGWIGGEILRKFRLILDFPDNRVFLAANRDFVFPIEANASGATLTATGPDLDQVEVRSVREGSPAAQAGLEPGDRIIVIDGEKASELSLDQIRGLFRQANHLQVLMVERLGRKVEIDLHLPPNL